MQRGAFFFRRFAASLLLLCPLFGNSMTRFVYPTGLTNMTSIDLLTLDNSCPAIVAAARIQIPGVVILACSSDPVVVSTQIMSSNLAVRVFPVTVQTSLPSNTVYNDVDYPVFQGAMTAFVSGAVSAAIAAAASAAGGSGGTTSTTVTVASAFGTATPEEYAAMSMIFGLILCAGAIIWGGKRVLKLFGTMGEA